MAIIDGRIIVNKQFINYGRITSDLYSCLPDSQVAYQPNRRTTKNFFQINQMIGKPIEFNKPLFMIFIDFTKAFYSIKLDKLWSILNKIYINFLKSLYGGSR